MTFCMGNIDVGADLFQRNMSTHQDFLNANQWRSLGQSCSHGF